MADLAMVTEMNARRSPDDVAYRLGDVRLSWAQVNDRAARCAAWLAARGVSRGDRVAVLLPNGLEFPVVYYGVLRLGAVVVPMNPLLHEREIQHCLEVSGARLVLSCELAGPAAAVAAEAVGIETHVLDPDGVRDVLAPDPLTEVDVPGPDDVAVILFTSGTTGRPKGATLTHHNLYSNAEVSQRCTSELRPSDVLLAALPLFHVFGQTCQMNGAAIAGASLTLLPRFDPERALRMVAEHGATQFSGVPSMYAAMLGVPDPQRFDVSGLRRCISGGAPLPVPVLHAFEARFGCTVLEGYGLSEASPVVTFNNPNRPRKAGTIGPPIEGVEVGIVDDDGRFLDDGEVGELVVRGPNVMAGYWQDAEATAATIRDGWLHTGDVATRDADGYYSIVDRLKDVILRGGLNVYPREVEDVVYEHPAVAEAAVVGVPHDILGEEVGAAVVLKPGQELTEAELVDFVKQRLAAYKYPHRLWFVEALPKGPTGKILKREITAPAAGVGFTAPPSSLTHH